jgi:hypothetical protein
MFARDKHFSLLRISVNYGRKKFYGTGPRSSVLKNMMSISSNSYRLFSGVLFLGLSNVCFTLKHKTRLKKTLQDDEAKKVL